MYKFWELFKDNVIIQGLISLILVSGMVYMYANQMDVPPVFTNIVLLVVGFYFGQKSQYSAIREAYKNEITTH